MSKERQERNKTRSQLEAYIEKSAERRLEEYDAWPWNLFKLELEESGIYQNFSGSCMLKMKESGTIRREYANKCPYMVKPGDDPPSKGSKIRKETENFYSLVKGDNSGFFAELVLYTTLCRERKILSENLPLEVYPKSEYPYMRHGNSDQIDALITLNQEVFPIEVYNGINLVDKSEDEDGRQRKFGQLKKNTVHGRPPNNPVLVSRLSAEDVREFTLENNGSVVDTGTIVGCTSRVPDLDDTLEYLNIDGQVEIIPPIETSDGHELDGEKYTSWATDNPEGLLPEKLEKSAGDIPESYKRAVRGGLHLLYVITFYRQASSPTEREASIVLQNGFNVLMRSSEGMSAEEIVDAGWSRFKNEYRNFETAKKRETSIRQEVQDHISTLRADNVIIKRSGGLYARASNHPHASLRHPIGYYRGM